jgi:DNA-binding MarR family transcriptional regulator
VKALFLTPKGQELDRKLKMYLHNLEEMMMAGISPEEKQVFQETILKMIENLEQIERSRE